MRGIEALNFTLFFVDFETVKYDGNSVGEGKASVQCSFYSAWKLLHRRQCSRNHPLQEPLTDPQLTLPSALYAFTKIRTKVWAGSHLS